MTTLDAETLQRIKELTGHWTVATALVLLKDYKISFTGNMIAFHRN